MRVDEAEVDELLATALAAARDAGGLIVRRWGNAASTPKGPGDVVTDADLEAEALIIERLRASEPRLPILAEEGGHTDGSTSDACWVIDPIDGTVNFALGIPFFAVSIAVVIDGAPVVGVVHDPLHHELFWAARGRGAFLGDDRLPSRADRVLRQGLLALALSPAIDPAQARRHLENADGVRHLGCTSLSLSYVAAGRFGAFVELDQVRVWDAAAGVVIASEAGAVVTTPNGAELRLPTDDSPFGLRVAHNNY